MQTSFCPLASLNIPANSRVETQRDLQRELSLSDVTLSSSLGGRVGRDDIIVSVDSVAR